MRTYERISRRCDVGDTTPDALARVVAEEAHAEQVDKLGEAYLAHPLRVRTYAARWAATAGVDPEAAQVVALLHDTVEDSDLTLDELAQLGFHGDVVASVDALTLRDDEPAEEYYARITPDCLAVVVKLADLDDNTDPRRTSALDEATRERLTVKYQKARDVMLAALRRNC